VLGHKFGLRPQPGRHGVQGGLDGDALVANLLVREPQDRQARRRVGLVAAPIAPLLRRRAVVAQAVRLDDQSQLRPVEVDAIAVEPLLREGWRQPGATRDRKKPALELRVGERECEPIEDVAEERHPGPAGEVIHGDPQRLWIDEVSLVRVVHGTLDFIALVTRGVVDEGEGWNGDANASVLADVI
jgi:hypothetical protein